MSSSRGFKAESTGKLRAIYRALNALGLAELQDIVDREQNRPPQGQADGSINATQREALSKASRKLLEAKSLVLQAGYLLTRT